MKVALDVRALTGRYTGDRTYWNNLVRSLVEVAPENDYILYSRLELPSEVIPRSSSVQIRILPAKSDRIWTFYTLAAGLRADRPDLVHVQYTIPPTWMCPCPVVTTVHDISFRLFPEWFPVRDRVLMNATVPTSMRSAAYVITDSESSRKDIQRTYQFSDSKVKAVPLGLSANIGAPSDSDPELWRTERRQELQGRNQAQSPYILALGVLQPRKNLVTLARAYGTLKRRYGVPHRLVFVGKAGWITRQDELLQAVRETGGNVAVENVEFTGYVPDEDLNLWYAGCDLFAHPSLYEGFGIPPLEAMACMAPTVVSDAPAMPEVVGDAAIVVAASDSEAWCEAMYRLISDDQLALQYRSLGYARSRLFTWTRTAEETLKIYKIVAERK